MGASQSGNQHGSHPQSLHGRSQQQSTGSRASCRSQDTGATSSSDDEDTAVDRLASTTRTGVLREVMTPKYANAAKRPEVQPQPVLKNVLTEDWEYASLTEDTVLLHVYDLEEDIRGVNGMLAFAVDEITIGGAFHAGVEVFGSEWSYGSRGVRNEAPRTAEGHAYRCTVPMGRTKLNKEQVAQILHEMCGTWRGADYDLLNRNCCCFAAELCRRLEVQDLPAWVDRLPRLLEGGRAMGRGVMQVGNQVGGIVRASISLVNGLIENQAGVPHCTCSVATDGTGQSSSVDIQSALSSLEGPVAVVSEEPQRGGELRRMKTLWEEGALQEERTEVTSARSRSPGPAPPAAPAGSPRPPGAEPPARGRSPAPEGSPRPAGAPGRGLSPRPGDLQTTRALGGGPFPVGADVEFYSNTHGKWIPTKVLAVHAGAGLCDLECRSKAPVERIRWPSGGGGQETARSTTGAPLARCQRMATVDFDEGLRPRSLSPMGLRAPSLPRPAAGGGYPVGSAVEYYSESYSRWIPSKVVAHHAATGLYDLDCRAGAAAERIRWPPQQADGAPAQPAPSRALTVDRDLSPARAAAPGPPGAPALPAPSRCLSDHSPVRAVAHGAPALPAPSRGLSDHSPVRAVAPGAHALSVPSRALSDHSPVRAAALGAPARPAPSRTPTLDRDLSPARGLVLGTPGFGGAVFKVGAAVEYKSSTHGRWIPAKVLAVAAPSGLLDLDCRSQVAPARVRWPQAPPAKPKPSAAPAAAWAAPAAAAAKAPLALPAKALAPPPAAGLAAQPAAAAPRPPPPAAGAAAAPLTPSSAAAPLTPSAAATPDHRITLFSRPEFSPPSVRGRRSSLPGGR